MDSLMCVSVLNLPERNFFCVLCVGTSHMNNN
jgi:hypothetical protein